MTTLDLEPDYTIFWERHGRCITIAYKLLAEFTDTAPKDIYNTLKNRGVLTKIESRSFMVNCIVNYSLESMTWSVKTATADALARVLFLRSNEELSRLESKIQKILP